MLVYVQLIVCFTLQDDPTIDPNFSPVMVLDHAPLPRTLSIATILDKFDNSQDENSKAISMTSLQLQYLCDGVTDLFDLEKGFENEPPIYRSPQIVSLDGSEYVRLYLNDSSGFTDSDVHSYFSVLQPTQQDNSVQDESSMEHSSIVLVDSNTDTVNVHEGESHQSSEKLTVFEDCCIRGDMLDANNCEANSIEPDVRDLYTCRDSLVVHVCS